MLIIKSLGSGASLFNKTRNHFSLLVEKDGHSILIDPATKYDKKVDFILVTQGDKDHWYYLFDYLKKFPNTKVYSSSGVLSRIYPQSKNFTVVEHKLKWNGVEILFMSIPPMVGVPAIGLRFDYKHYKISIIPEYDSLGKYERDLIKNTIWIIGVGEYDKRKPKDHKATFLEMINMANELKPKNIFVTNFRKSTLAHKNEMLEKLKPFNGALLKDGSVIKFNKNLEVEKTKYHRGLYLVKPHASYILKGIKTMILKQKKFNMNDEKLLLVDNNYAYGYLELDKPFKINNEKEFKKYSKKHQVTDSEFKKWNWKFPVFAYKIKSFNKFSNLKPVNLPKGIQTFVIDAEKYIEPEKISKWYVPYKPKEYRNDQLMDDARLFAAVYSKISNGKKVRIQADKDKYFTKDILINDFAVPLYKEIASRVKDGKMEYKINLDNASQSYKDFWNDIKEKLSQSEIEALTGDLSPAGISGLENKMAVKPNYYSLAKPVYRMYFEQLQDNLKSVKWDKEKLLIDTKWDGLRMTIGKSGGKGWAFVDPENLKHKSPNISNRIPAIISEIESTYPDNTVLDGEFLAMNPNKYEMLHRTDANAILNSNMSGKELENYAVIFIFDVLFYDGTDLRGMPLHERLEYLSRLKSTKHIWIEKVSTKFPDKADGFFVNGNETKKIIEIANFVRKAKNGRPKYCAEGIMLKKLDWQYEYPQNHGWAKAKYYEEIDLRVLDKKTVKGAKATWNYYLGYDTPKDFAESYLSITTKDWYGKVHAIKNGRIIAVGKDCKKYLDDDSVKFVTFMGKTDNTNIKVNINDILRIAAEEVLKFNNPENDKYPRYSFYIGRALEPIPEKDVTDTIELIDKLSHFEPERIPIDELRHIKQTIKGLNLNKETILQWVENGKIPEDEYNKIVKPLEPLPKILYPEYQDGYLAWAQWHIRGLEHEDVLKWQKGEISTKELVKGHSLHCDLRMQFGKKKQLQQWVLLDNDMESYLRGFKGEIDPKTNNSQKMLAVVKPSALEPGNIVKEQRELLLDDKGASIVQEYELKDKSFIIPAGDVGATEYKDAYLMAIWTGRVKFGLQREDAHEMFLYPDDNLPEKNKKLFDGKYIVRCFKAGQDKRWWFFKSFDTPKPLDPIKHSWTAHYWPIPADQIEKFGSPAHRDESKQLYVKYLKKSSDLEV